MHHLIFRYVKLVQLIKFGPGILKMHFVHSSLESSSLLCRSRTEGRQSSHKFEKGIHLRAECHLSSANAATLAIAHLVNAFKGNEANQRGNPRMSMDRMHAIASFSQNSSLLKLDDRTIELVAKRRN